MRRAICPGSFDPVTNGHLDVIMRAAKLFDEVVVSVVKNPQKQPLFSLEERAQMIREACAGMPNVRVETFSGLLVRHAKEIGAQAIVKGLRALSDFEYELQQAQTNHRQEPTVETVFLATDVQYSFLSSSMVREVAELGGVVNGMVPLNVERKLRDKFSS